jgi:prevent-host-death family protein
MQVTAKDLRFHSSELLNTVKRGEEVIITYRGKPCAKLVPIKEPDSTLSKNELFGIWQEHDQSQDVNNYVKNLRKSRFDVD